MTYSEKIAAISKSTDNYTVSYDYYILESDVHREAWALTFATIAKGAKALIHTITK